jgi:signal peptide peptidase SppA
MHRAGILAQSSGGVSAESLGAQLDALVADRQVRAICMVFDTPGGAVTGVPELAKKIFDFRGDKKIVGIADAFAASAGYWLASQCRELSVAPSGQVGSIGVLAAHVDESKAEEMAGLKTTIVSAGRYKAEFDPSAPLSDEARAELQSKVDDYYQMFTDSVARGRGVAESRVRNNFGEGRMATAKQAVGRQMADRVETLQQLLTRLNAGDADGSGLAIGPGGDSDLEGRRAASTAASTALARAEQVERECFGEAAMARARAEEVERETAGDRRGERGRPINGGRVATGRDAAMARARAAAVERECRGGK